MSETTNQINTHNKYLIFDFDGVLADSLEVSLKAMVVPLGPRKSIEEAREKALAYSNTKPNHTKHHTLTVQEMAEQKEARKVLAKKLLLLGVPLFQDFIDEIKNIESFYCAIVSSNDEDMIKQMVKDTGLSFTHILGFGDHHSKEEKIEHICKDRGVNVADVYYFTDTKADVYELQDFISAGKLIGCARGYSGYEALCEVIGEKNVLKEAKEVHEIIKSS